MKDKIKFIGIVGTSFFLGIFLACTPSARKAPNKDKYTVDTQMMIKICSKLSKEPSAAKMFEVANDLQKARTVSCVDFVGECSLYGKFLTRVSQIGKDGFVSHQERDALVKDCNALKTTISEGMAKLNP